MIDALKLEPGINFDSNGVDKRCGTERELLAIYSELIGTLRRVICPEANIYITMKCGNVQFKGTLSTRPTTQTNQIR